MKNIVCPYPSCGEVYEDEGECVSYHGEGEPVVVGCGQCGQDFEVHETVVRTYETKAVPIVELSQRR